MQLHQQRVIDEKTELNERLAKLVSFLDSERSDPIPREEHERMIRQAEIMQEYADVLEERISAFPKGAPQ